MNPSLVISAPGSVLPGSTFSISITGTDPDGDLSWLVVRSQNRGIVGQWVVGGSSAERTVQLNAPDAGLMYFRGEAGDNDGGAIAGPWKGIAVAASVPGVPVPTPAESPFLDTGNLPAQSTPMTSVAPTVSIDAPDVVFSGQQFWVNVIAHDDNSDLFTLGIRQQGVGIIGSWDLSDNNATDAGRRVSIVAQSFGPIWVRAEVHDKSGLEYTSDWVGVRVIGQPMPSDDYVHTWLRIDRQPTSSPGVYFAQATALPGAPSSIAVAVDAANQANSNFGGIWTPDQLIDFIQTSWSDNAAQTVNAGIFVTPIPAGPGIQVADFTPDPISVPAVVNDPIILTPGTVVQTPTTSQQQQTGSASPTLALSLPNQVYPRQKFTVTITAADPNGDLNSMGIRWQGQGLVQRWDISGTSATNSVEITAPDDTGPILFRGEVFDNAGHGVEGEWQTVTVHTEANFDGTHRLAGWDAQGNEVYHLVNEAGNTVEWAVRAGDDSRTIIEGSLRYLTGGDAEASQVTSLTPPANSTSTGSVTANTGKSGTGMLLLLAGAAGLGYLALRGRKSSGS